MMNLFLIGVIVVGLGVVFVWFKLCKASREIDRLFRTNASLESQVLRQKAEIQRKERELKNAQTKRKNDEMVKPMPAAAVDDQLHAKGYLRDDSVGLSGVQPDLSKPCGHDGNETSGACSQSDL